MNLEQLQRAVFEVTRQPLTPSEKLRPRLPDGRSIREIANALIKPNDRMTSFDRLQIYSQQYWFRILGSFSEDFPGLRSLVGERKFEKLATAYLNECPSESFTLRNLGSRLEAWLRKHPAYIAGVERVAMDMVRLEWADIEAFDERELPRLTAEDAAKLSGDTFFRLQPHLRLLELAYPVDELLLRIRGQDSRSDTVSNAVIKFPHSSRIRRSSLPRPRKVYLAVYRLQGSVYFKRLTRDAFALLQTLAQGEPLEEAIEIALLRRRRNVDRLSAQVQEWFQNWSSLGWLAPQS
ncbi:MAG: putative DNA-binding domain-containing protein [Terriglobia bacterium]